MSTSPSPTPVAGYWPSLLRSARRIVGARSLAILVRTAHLAAMAFLVGGRHFRVEEAALQPWPVLTALTGVGLLASEASHSRHWIHQVRGVTAVVHVGVAALVSVAPGMTRPAIAAALIIGSVGSHLPRTIRKWSLLRRRIMD
jgi:hypothetical protein